MNHSKLICAVNNTLQILGENEIIKISAYNKIEELYTCDKFSRSSGQHTVALGALLETRLGIVSGVERCVLEDLCPKVQWLHRFEC